MGFWGKLKRVGLKVARGGIAVATGGASERLIQAAKQLGVAVRPERPDAKVPTIETPRVRAIITKYKGAGARATRLSAPRRLKRPKDLVEFTDRKDAKDALPGQLPTPRLDWPGPRRKMSAKERRAAAAGGDLIAQKELAEKPKRQFTEKQLAAQRRFAEMVRARRAAK